MENVNEGFKWNVGDIFDAVAEVVPSDRPALIHDGQVLTWGELDKRSNNLARTLHEKGAKPDDKIAFYLSNCSEYVELLVACMKGRYVHVNVNYRYLEDELHYIVDNSDAKFVFYSDDFAGRIANIKDRCDKVSAFVEVGSEAVSNDFSESYQSYIQGSGQKLDIERSPDDLLFIYTGGTTGMPKGVMWQSHDLWGGLGFGQAHACARNKTVENLNDFQNCVKENHSVIRQIVACPLMHGTGLLSAITTMTGGGTVVTLPGSSFDPELIWDTVESQSVKSVVIVGDAFAKPLLNALQSHPNRWDLSSLKFLLSSGVMWSQHVKNDLMKILPNMLCVDSFASSEALGFGSSVSSAAGGVKTARFEINERCKVFTEDHREVEPGSGERGFVARKGSIPMGYYKDEKKTAETFPTINGVRYSIPGDWCTVESDGTLNLLGRGSVCINTAGEKVYPEEVEEALKSHPTIEDALVVGIEDDKWGMAVTAVVELSAGKSFEKDAVHSHIKNALAAYKAPKNYYTVEKMFRAPNGKADYKSAKQFALDQNA